MSQSPVLALVPNASLSSPQPFLRVIRVLGPAPCSGIWHSRVLPRPSPQVVDYYKEACRALENSETASLLGKIQKDWKKLVQMKIYYFAAVAHVSGGNWGALPVLPSHLGMLLPALEQLWPLPGFFLLLSKLSLELQSSDPSFFPAAHGEAG